MPLEGLKSMRLAAVFALALFAMGAAADSSLDRVFDEGSLLIAMDPPYGVMEFYDEDDRLRGIDVDLGITIANDLGVALAIETMPFAKLFEALDSGEVDLVISAVTITEERQKTMRFSAPYFDAALSIAVRADESAIGSERDLKGRRVGVIEGTIGENHVRKSEHVDEDLIRTFRDNRARLDALKRGEVDALIVHFAASTEPEIKMLDEPISQSYYGVVGRLDDVALMARVDAVLRRMKRNGGLKALRDRYIK